MVTAALNDNPPRTRLQRLFQFPFTPIEADMFMEHLKTAEKDNGFARDVLLTWEIQTGRFKEAREIMSGEGHGDEKRRVIREGLEIAKLSI